MSSVKSVQTDDAEGERGQNDGKPVGADRNSKRPSPAYAFSAMACAFLLFIMAFGYIYSAGAVENIGVINPAKVYLRIVFLVAGWLTEHAALDLLEFGRVYLEHLL